MRSCVRQIVASLAMVAVSTAAGAFSSEKWLAERGDDSDMLRLRAAYAECVKKLESPAENVSLPLETHSDGTVKSRLKAERAHMFMDSGFVWAEKIRVEQFREDGTLAASLDADNCVIDRNTKSGWVEGAARMVYGDSSVRGRGIYFSLPREFIKIFSESEIRTKHGGFDPRSLIK
ncbi:MAG: hypothetical protein ACI4Q3_06245 [Kiritimatiellia bacterium]